MAVFPYARRALWRPVRLPWLIAAAVLISTSSAIVTVPALSDWNRGAEAPAIVSTASESEPGLSPAPAWSPRQLDALTASVAALSGVAAEAQQPAALESAAAVEAAARVLADRTAEVSEAPVVVVVDPAPDAAAINVETVAVATGSETVATVDAPLVQEQAPPQLQPVVNAPIGAVERWAAAGVVIVTEGQSLDDVSLANIDAALSILPASILANLGNPALGSLHILVNTEGRVLSGDQPYRGPANFFSTNEGKNELVLYPQQSVFTIVHELGHAYNLRRIAAGRYAMVLLDAEMRSFLTATGWQIGSTDDQIRGAVDHMHVDYSYAGSFHWPRLSNDDPLEDFANSFAMFFLDPAGLSASSPERYAWMAETFGN